MLRKCTESETSWVLMSPKTILFIYQHVDAFFLMFVTNRDWTYIAQAPLSWHWCLQDAQDYRNRLVTAVEWYHALPDSEEILNSTSVSSHSQKKGQERQATGWEVKWNLEEFSALLLELETLSMYTQYQTSLEFIGATTTRFIYQLVKLFVHKH